MSNTPTLSRQIIAATIRNQIGAYALMCQGAREYFHGDFKPEGVSEALPGLRFTAKPKARLVHVFILLQPNDTYRVVVQSRVTKPTQQHKVLLDLEGVYADSLTDIITYLDKEV